MNSLNKFFAYLNDVHFQKRLKKVNVFICFVSFFYIGNFIRVNIDYSFTLRGINIVELVCLIIIFIFVGINWVNYSNHNNQTLNNKIFWDWSASNLGKYFPGGVGLISIRLNQDETKTNSKKVIFGLLEEQFLGPLISLPVLLILLPFINNENILWLFAFLQIIFLYIFKKIYFLNLKIKKTSLLNYSSYFLISLLGTNFLTIYIFQNFGFSNFIQHAFYYLISTYIGLLFVGVPAGIGIREAFFIYFSGSGLIVVEQVEILLYIRVLYLITDLIFGLSGIFGKKITTKF
tara:strand:- start:501 stop:1370 length:870 start_codon:yes stop_codon:yes gene_type:complete